MVYYDNNKYSVGKTTIHFNSKTDKVYTKYIYYYLLYNKELLQNYFKGLNQKSITNEDLLKIKIAIPSLKKQQEIIDIITKYDLEQIHIKNHYENVKKINKQLFIM